ncbi:MAG: hypothetical protein R3D98_07285 [Candidatus Krumholzibacteriia bacterium]
MCAAVGLLGPPPRACAQSLAADLPLILDDLDAGGVIAAGVEVDPRLVPRAMVRRLALLGGEFPPPYEPTTGAELVGTVRRAWRRGGPGLLLPAQRRELAWLLARFGRQRRPVSWSSCECREPQVHASLGGRVALWELGGGDVVAGEAGLVGRGLLATLEPDLSLWLGRFWLAVTPRLEVPLDRSGRGLAPAFGYAGWPEPTGRPGLGRARGPAVARVAVPRAVAGAQLGGWALAAGVFPAAVGVGLDGEGLTLDHQADSVPQVLLRRTRPLAWSGWLSWFDPEHVLVRVGSTSPQTISYATPRGRQSRRARPLLTQWLLTWDHTPWWRTTVVGTALSAAREGHSLWPDLLQVNLPLLDATWSEVDYGPVTDRLVSLIMEARWREAPWPWLPSAAGRVWWEYGGEDFRPHEVLPFLPEISAPASLVGCELLDSRWDLGVEYLDTRHPRVLWYGNNGFDAGYSHAGELLGHELGGAAAAWTALVRWRTAAGADEWELRGRTAGWDGARLPATARRREVSLRWRHLALTGSWSLGVAWLEERVDRLTDHWWQARAARSF